MRFTILSFSTVDAATITRLTLVIGFAFSMGVIRFDQREALEEAEANANSYGNIRASICCLRTAALRELSRRYMDLGLAFYDEGNACRQQISMVVAARNASFTRPGRAVALT